MIGLSFLLGVSLAVSISGSLTFGALLFLISLFRWTQQKPQWKGPRAADLVLMALVGWTTLSTVVQGAAGLGSALSFQSAVLMAPLVLYFLSEREIQVCLWGFGVGAAAAGAVGLLQPFVGWPYGFGELVPEWPERIVKFWSHRGGRAYGFSSHPLTYAEILAPAFFLLIGALVLNSGDGKKKGLPMIAMILVAGGIVVSQSRGVWLGVAAGGLIALRAFSWRIRIAALVSAVALVATVTLVSPQYRARLFSIVSTQAGQAGDRLSNNTRRELWRQSGDRIRKKPILGWGLKKAVLTTFDPVLNAPREWNESHNIYLQTAMEAGLPALVFFLALAGMLVWFAAGLERPLNWGALGCVVFFLVAGLTESWTRDKEVAFLFWGLLGWVERRRRNRGTLEEKTV